MTRYRRLSAVALTGVLLVGGITACGEEGGDDGIVEEENGGLGEEENGVVGGEENGVVGGEGEVVDE